MISALAMEKKFQFNQPTQTLETSRLRAEELRHPFLPILAAQATGDGNNPRK